MFIFCVSFIFFTVTRLNTQSLIIMQLIVIILSHKLLLSPKGGIPYIRLKTEKREPFMFMDECDTNRSER